MTPARPSPRAVSPSMIRQHLIPFQLPSPRTTEQNLPKFLWPQSQHRRRTHRYPARFMPLKLPPILVRQPTSIANFSSNCHSAAVSRLSHKSASFMHFERAKVKIRRPRSARRLLFRADLNFAIDHLLMNENFQPRSEITNGKNRISFFPGSAQIV